MHQNQMYVRYTQLGGRAILWLSTIAFAVLSVRFLSGIDPLAPGALFLSAMVLSHLSAAQIVKRKRRSTWVELGRPGLIPSFSRGGLARLLWSGAFRGQLNWPLFLAAAFFNFATISSLYWLLSLGLAFLS